MRLCDLFEAKFDYGFDVEDDIGHDAPPQQPVLDPKQQELVDRHRRKQNRIRFRSAEQRRREREQELYAPEHDYYGTQGSRHVPKSVVGYKPFKWPMIRFGLFGQRSRIGFDAEVRREIGNATHEAGVSCFKAKEHKGGYLIEEHAGQAIYTVGFDPDRLLYPWVRQMRSRFERWLRDGTPMDIFMLRGNLVSFGKQNEWLSVGADGEYLLDTRKPYHSEHVDPDHLWLHERLTLRQFYETSVSRTISH